MSEAEHQIETGKMNSDTDAELVRMEEEVRNDKESEQGVSEQKMKSEAQDERKGQDPLIVRAGEKEDKRKRLDLKDEEKDAKQAVDAKHGEKQKKLDTSPKKREKEEEGKKAKKEKSENKANSTTGHPEGGKGEEKDMKDKKEEKKEKKEEEKEEEMKEEKKKKKEKKEKKKKKEDTKDLMDTKEEKEEVKKEEKKDKKEDMEEEIKEEKKEAKKKEKKEEKKKEKKEKSSRSSSERIAKKLEQINAKIVRILAKKEGYELRLKEALERERQESEKTEQRETSTTVVENSANDSTRPGLRSEEGIVTDQSRPVDDASAKESNNRSAERGLSGSLSRTASVVEATPAELMEEVANQKKVVEKLSKLVVDDASAKESNNHSAERGLSGSLSRTASLLEATPEELMEEVASQKKVVEKLSKVGIRDGSEANSPLPMEDPDVLMTGTGEVLKHTLQVDDSKDIGTS